MLDKKTAALKDLKSRLEAHQRSLDEAEAVLEVDITPSQIFTVATAACMI
jgi:hypothetical protein